MDGRVAQLQVTGMTHETLKLEVLMGCRNGGDLFDLRCDVRKAIVQAMASNEPASLNRARLLVEMKATQ